MLKKYRFFYLVLASLIYYGTAPISYAQSLANPKSAVTIQSDHLEYHHQTGVAIHTGNVLVQQHNQKLKAHTLSIYRDPTNPKLIHKMIAKGSKQSPATFEGELNTKKNTKQNPIYGHAQIIFYFSFLKKIIL